MALSLLVFVNDNNFMLNNSNSQLSKLPIFRKDFHPSLITLGYLYT
jgi:hypothetical protein